MLIDAAVYNGLVKLRIIGQTLFGNMKAMLKCIIFVVGQYKVTGDFYSSDCYNVVKYN